MQILLGFLLRAIAQQGRPKGRSCAQFISPISKVSYVWWISTQTAEKNIVSFSRYLNFSGNTILPKRYMFYLCVIFQIRSEIYITWNKFLSSIINDSLNPVGSTVLYDSKNIWCFKRTFFKLSYPPPGFRDSKKVLLFSK